MSVQIKQENFMKPLSGIAKGSRKIADVHKRRTAYLKRLTNAKLVKCIRRRNNHAFDVLIGRHERKLKYLLRAILFDKSAVDDVAQDVWETVIHRLRSSAYKESGHFYGWLSTLAFRKATDVNRQRMYNPEFISYDPASHDAVDFSENFSEQDVLVKEAKKIISTFNEQEKMIFKMRNEDGMSFEKIAGKTNWNLRSVQSCNRRLMKRIRKELKFSAVSS